ncbi:MULTISPECIES: WecB/TagA/CpsF family glycosyltransferase [unclassified Halomonas]|uniref:WecB/TagA/CpsF family glycosyltransferase n=1 Tax=unclassified Halomonas TaxID=2609666 RepID=UPI002076A2B4|nr:MULTISPECIES: WecB/TagA/CpsF family glycosyltransferase [unclassified Halomonas]
MNAINHALHTPLTTRLFGLPLVNATRIAAVEDILSMTRLRKKSTVNFVNAHCINTAMRHPKYRAALEASDRLLPDGSGMRIASRWANAPFGENLNGTDLFPIICQQAAQRGLSIYLLGGRPATAERAAARMVERFPALKIAGTQDGYFDADDSERVIATVNASQPDLVLVGFGVPTQELWINAHRDAIDAPVVMGVGGLFDYYAGNIPRAPKAMRRVGCEWIWRLMQEPRRLASRYLIGNTLFLALALLHALSLHHPMRLFQAFLKRALDITIAGSAVVMLSPAIALIVACIRLEDGGPVLFSQQRIGAKGKPFKMFKFRSMVQNAEARRAELMAQSEREGACFKMKKDPRITRVGALLRRASLDELPQLLNVLRGEMSIVGPRPALPDEVVNYQGQSWLRLMGKPGITCIWQVSGRADIPFDRQVEMDVEYLQNPSLWQDIKLIFKTIPAVITARGAY